MGSESLPWRVGVQMVYLEASIVHSSFIQIHWFPFWEVSGNSSVGLIYHDDFLLVFPGHCGNLIRRALRHNGSSTRYDVAMCLIVTNLMLLPILLLWLIPIPYEILRHSYSVMTSTWTMLHDSFHSLFAQLFSGIAISVVWWCRTKVPIVHQVRQR